jgi:hypothetical protein
VRAAVAGRAVRLFEMRVCRDFRAGEMTGLFTERESQPRSDGHRTLASPACSNMASVSTESTDLGCLETTMDVRWICMLLAADGINVAPRMYGSRRAKFAGLFGCPTDAWLGFR